MNETEKKAWGMVLPLWKHLGTNDYSNKFIRDINDSLSARPSRLKNHVLMKLGYDRCMHGCPFCAYFFCSKGCPLGSCDDISVGCWNYNYNFWQIDMYEYVKHNRHYALKFYNELIIKFIERCMEE